MFPKSLVSALCLLVLTAAPLSAVADRLVMKNGDVITGNISLVTDEEVLIEPSYADEFSVDLAEVESIDIEETFEVELADKSKVDARITVDESGAQVLDVDGDTQPLVLTDIAEAAEPEPYFDWGAATDWSTTINNGNTDSRNTLLFLQGNVKHGDHRHFGDLTFRREETDGVDTKQQDLFNYQYNYLVNDPWYIGGSFTFERDPIRELDHRYTAGFLIGRDIFDDADKFLTVSFGAGYSSEEIGLEEEDGLVGLWNLRYTHTLWSKVDFFHNHNVTQQFYGNDNLIIKSNTGFSLDIIDDLYTSVSFRYDYETEPAPGSSKDDTTLSFGIGYSFN